jgi:hypothetical protein
MYVPIGNLLMGVEDEANAKDSRFVCFDAKYFAIVVTGALI